MSPRLELTGITKRFPGGVLANDAVDLRVEPGQIHALLGENGAGKSTLVKIIYGALRADAGTIQFEGREVDIPSPRAARELGIGMVFQHFSLFEAMSVLENVALGIDHGASRRALAKEIAEVSRSYGLPLAPERGVHELSVGERQRIEVVRCLLQSPKLLIMDEPTSVLTPQEARRLFETLRKLAGEGVSILYISHKLDEIRALCERATILRQGRVVAEADPRTESAKSLAATMIGSDFGAPARPGGDTGEVRLAVRNLSQPAANAFAVALDGIDLEVRAGEIVGIAGVAGNGQSELFEALAGERLAARADVVMIDGRPSGRTGASGRRTLGLCAIPEERNGHGAVADLSLTDNAILSAHRRRRLASAGFLRFERARTFAEAVVERFKVRTAGVDHAASSLSGGNLQKFIVGREMLQDPGILIAAQPTWGVDAGAASAIHQALLDLAAAGAAVLVISQDLDELLQLTDRIAVINGGRLSDLLPTRAARTEELGLLMGGIHGAAPAQPEPGVPAAPLEPALA